MQGICWICHEDSDKSVIRNACSCHGNTGAAHVDCLNRWVLGSGASKRYHYGSEFDDEPQLEGISEGAFIDSDAEGPEDDGTAQLHPHCQVCGEMYTVKCAQLVHADNIPPEGSNGLLLLGFLMRRLLLPLGGKIALAMAAMSMAFIILPWLYGFVFLFAHGSQLCLQQRVLQAIPFVRPSAPSANPCTKSIFFRSDVALSSYHASRMEMCNITNTSTEGICPVAFPLLECETGHVLPFALLLESVSFYLQWVPNGASQILRLSEALTWSHDDVFYFEDGLGYSKPSHGWMFWAVVAKPWIIGLVTALVYRAMAHNFLGFIRFIRQYHTRNGRRDVAAYFPFLDLEEDTRKPTPSPREMTTFAIHDTNRLPGPPLLLRFMSRIEEILDLCDCSRLTVLDPKSSSIVSVIETLVVKRLAIEVFIVCCWWYTLISCPESWLPAIVVVVSVSLSIRILKPPILRASRRYFDPFAYILRWGPESHSSDVLVWYCAYVGEVVVFWLVLPIIGGFVVQQAAAPYFAIEYPLSQVLQGDTSKFYIPSLGLTLWYFVLGNLYLLILIEVEGRIVMPLFAPGIHLYFMRAVNFSSSKVNKRLLMGWKFVFCHIYDADPLFMIWELCTTGTCELVALFCFLRTPCVMMEFASGLLPNGAVSTMSKPPSSSDLICVSSANCFVSSVFTWHNVVAAILMVQLVCCVTSVYPIQRVFLTVAYPLSDFLGTTLGSCPALFDERRRTILRQWLTESTSETLEERMPQVPLSQMQSMRDNEIYQRGGWRLRLQCFCVGAIFLLSGCVLLWSPSIVCWVFLAPLLESTGLESRAITALSALLTPFFVYDPKLFAIAGAMAAAILVSVPLCVVEMIWYAMSKVMSLSAAENGAPKATRSQLQPPQRCGLLRWTWVKYLLRCAIERDQQLSPSVVSKH